MSLVSFAASFSIHSISTHVSVFCTISSQNVEDHVAFVITVPTALAIFLAVFVLVCIESIFKKLLRVFSLVIWACLVAMGYLFMFSGGIICPWDQVRHSDFPWTFQILLQKTYLQYVQTISSHMSTRNLSQWRCYVPSLKVLSMPVLNRKIKKLLYNSYIKAKSTTF